MHTRIKSIFGLMALCLGIAACQVLPEESYPGQTRLNATMEEGPDTKTVLSPADEQVLKVLWSENDEIAVFIDGATSSETFRLIEGAGNTEGVFSGKGEGSRYVSLYPSSMIPSRSGDVLRFTFPEEQTYVPGSFAPGASPMIAVSDSPDLRFRNIASVLQVSLKGRHEVTRIVFRSNDPSVKVSGKASASFADPANPVLSVDSKACDSLSLTVSGVKLSESEPTGFYLVLPPQTYKGGFTVRVYTGERYMDKVYSSDFTMVRSRLHKAAPFVFQPNGLDTSTELEGSGTESDPFLIQSLPDLILMRDAVNDQTTITSSSGINVQASKAHYLLTTDIDMTLACSKASRKSWMPIGNGGDSGTPAFSGVFNGAGHTISNLFIDNSNAYQGLFGRLSGATIKDLTLAGEVNAGDNCGLVVGYSYDTVIENCHTSGTLKGKSYTGAFSGQGKYTTILYSTNSAVVSGGGSVGGFIGYAEFECFVDNCTNFAHIKETANCGGIIGFQNAGRILNCKNTGSVECYSNGGGIAGYLWGGGKVLNSINTGDVSVTDFCAGGIGGFVSSYGVAYQGAALIANCYSTGKVTGRSYIGALAGFIGLLENETPLGDEPISSAWVKNSYWLQEDGGSEIPAVGGGPGISENNFALSHAQMCGTVPYRGVLYTMDDGTQFSSLLDALNAGASEWGKRAMSLVAPFGAQNPDLVLMGWEYVSSGGYPSLTDLKAIKPGSGIQEFSVSGNDFSFNALEGKFETMVTSSSEYSLGGLPGWIRKTDTKTHDNRPHSKTWCFAVAPNLSSEPRSATLTFTNKAGTILKVNIKQEGLYLEADTEELIFASYEASKRFGVSSSIAWTVSSDAQWCQAVPAVGTGKGVVSVQVEENTADKARSATLTVSSSDGTVKRTVSVIQSGHSQEDPVDWTQASFVHKSLAMRFTATWCGWCPRMNRSIKRAQELYPGKISYVALHDDSSDLAFDQCGYLNSQYRISGFPSGIIDGRTYISNVAVETAAGKIVAAVKETEQKYGTVTGVDIISSVSGRSAQVDVGVYVKKAGEYKITVLLLENGIINAQEDYEEGAHPRYVHDNVARVSMTNVQGDPFSVTEDYSVKRFNFNATIPSTYNISNMHVLVYIQRAFGSYPVIQTGNYGGFFVDNSAAVELGGSLRLALESSSGGEGGDDGDKGLNEDIVPGDDIEMN